MVFNVKFEVRDASLDRDIVIFQKNEYENQDNYAVAWQVLQNVNPNTNHSFTFPLYNHISVSDSYNDFSPLRKAEPGSGYDLVKSHSGDILQISTTLAEKPDEIEVRNKLSEGAINANIYKDGKLLAQEKDLLPGDKAVFKFSPTIYIANIPEIKEGDIINPQLVSQITTEINLSGIESADIVMTGGGSGPSATPFTFTLENIQRV